MANIEIYTKATCPFCIRAKALLNSKGVTFHELPIDGDAAKREEMIQRSGHGHTQHHFINAFSQLGGGGIQIKFNFRLPVFLENLRRVRRFKRDIFGIDTLDLEGHFGAVLF